MARKGTTKGKGTWYCSICLSVATPNRTDNEEFAHFTSRAAVELEYEAKQRTESWNQNRTDVHEHEEQSMQGCSLDLSHRIGVEPTSRDTREVDTLNVTPLGSPITPVQDSHRDLVYERWQSNSPNTKRVGEITRCTTQGESQALGRGRGSAACPKSATSHADVPFVAKDRKGCAER